MRPGARARATTPDGTRLPIPLPPLTPLLPTQPVCAEYALPPSAAPVPAASPFLSRSPFWQLPFFNAPQYPFLAFAPPRRRAGPAWTRGPGARGGQPGKPVCGSHCSVVLQVLLTRASVTFGIVRRRQKLSRVKFHWMSRSAGESPARRGDWHGCPSSRAVQWAFQ